MNVQKRNARALITIEDDGLEYQRINIKMSSSPFLDWIKAEALINLELVWVLAIVEDVINSHGGNIQLGKSKHNGLLVKIFLPF